MTESVRYGTSERTLAKGREANASRNGRSETSRASVSILETRQLRRIESVGEKALRTAWSRQWRESHPDRLTDRPKGLDSAVGGHEQHAFTGGRRREVIEAIGRSLDDNVAS